MENLSLKIRNFVTDYKQSVEKIRIELKKYIYSHNLSALVIGVSGGIDSALVCALAKPVCDELGIPIIGRSISIITNKPDEEERANAIGEAFCHNFEHIDMSSEFTAMLNSVTPQGIHETDRQYKIRLGNVKARLRMIKLYDLASANGGLVMSTDNLTELLLGFWTLAGDIGDLSIIQSLWKTEVYKMAEYLIESELKDANAIALQMCIDCNATDGLGITSTDLDQILPDWKERHTSTKTGYTEVDNIFIKYFKGDKSLEDTAPIKRYYKTMFKRNWPHVFEREDVI